MFIKPKFRSFFAFITIFLLLFFYLKVKYNFFFKEQINGDLVEYWIEATKKYDKIIMDSKDINEFNKKIIDKQLMDNIASVELNYDLLSCPEFIDREYIISAIQASHLYMSIPDEEYYNLDSLYEKNKVSYAIVTNKTNLRSIPTDIHIFSKNGFDGVQNRAIKFGEPVIVLNQTKDKIWTFVQTNNCFGWVKTDDFAYVDKKIFSEYVNMEHFVVVIDKSVIIDDHYLDMGVKLKIESETNKGYIVYFPKRNHDGNLLFARILIDKNDKFNAGYLPYTRHNTIKQALKYYGTPYSFGDLNNGIDCSGFILNVYSTFGFTFPRNSKKQQSMSDKFINIPGWKNKNLVLNKAEPGDLLFFPGHIMMYLGKIDKKHYIIHSLAFAGDNKRQKIEVMNVCIDNLKNIKRISGKTFLKSITSLTKIE